MTGPGVVSSIGPGVAEFAEALVLADEVVVLDVFGAREEPEPGVTGALIADAIAPPARAHFEPSFAKVPALVSGTLKLCLHWGHENVIMAWDSLGAARQWNMPNMVRCCPSIAGPRPARRWSSRQPASSW